MGYKLTVTKISLTRFAIVFSISAVIIRFATNLKWYEISNKNNGNPYSLTKILVVIKSKVNHKYFVLVISYLSHRYII